MTRRVEAVSCAVAGPISSLHAACFPEDPWDEAAIAQILRMPGFFGRVGWDEDVPVGFALALDLGKEAEILSLGVVLESRRNGMGSSLLAALFHDARLRASDSVVLEVAVNNTAARALYAASGFTVVGYRRNYYRRTGCSIDGLILRRPLATALPET
jgi:[ribosomal protein S18]-alanine N-acetyltransferase